MYVRLGMWVLTSSDQGEAASDKCGLRRKSLPLSLSVAKRLSGGIGGLSLGLCRYEKVFEQNLPGKPPLGQWD